MTPKGQTNRRFTPNDDYRKNYLCIFEKEENEATREAESGQVQEGEKIEDGWAHSTLCDFAVPEESVETVPRIHNSELCK